MEKYKVLVYKSLARDTPGYGNCNNYYFECDCVNGDGEFAFVSAQSHDDVLATRAIEKAISLFLEDAVEQDVNPHIFDLSDVEKVYIDEFIKEHYERRNFYGMQ